MPSLELVWDDLKYFAIVGREGSVALASKLAGVEHSTVARRISRLEETLNLRLFNRMARAWILTEEGDALLTRVALIEEQVLGLRNFASSLENSRGSVCVTAPPSFLSEVIAPALSQFHKIHPQIELNLIGETREANLSRGEADIAFRMAQVDGAELVTRKVCDIRYEFYGLAKWELVSPEERLFISYSKTYQPNLQAAVHRHVGKRAILSQTNDLRVALRFAKEGAAIALLPEFLASEVAELTVIEKAVPEIYSPVHLVMQQHVRKAQRVRIVADYLCSQIPRYPG